MMRLIRSEIRKLDGSLALLLGVIAPALPAILITLSVSTSTRTAYWSTIFDSFMMPVWAFFLMPMIVAAFTTLIAQIEYQAQGWDHILALPIARWKVFASKAVVVLLGVTSMTVLAIIFTGLGALLGSAISGQAVGGAIELGELSRKTGLIIAASMFFVALQTWVAFRFSSFVVSLSFGIGGTLVALTVAMTGTARADWFPWVLPMKVLTAADPIEIALIGAAGGAIVSAAMVANLSRHSFR